MGVLIYESSFQAVSIILLGLVRCLSEGWWVLELKIGFFVGNDLATIYVVEGVRMVG